MRKTAMSKDTEDSSDSKEKVEFEPEDIPKSKIYEIKANAEDSADDDGSEED